MCGCGAPGVAKGIPDEALCASPRAFLALTEFLTREIVPFSKMPADNNAT